MQKDKSQFCERRISQVKPLTVEQLPQVIELDRLCFGGLWTLEGYRQELESPTSDVLAISIPEAAKSASPISPESEILVGISCVWAVLDEAHITILGVHPNYRRQGIGQRLLTGILDVARKRGLERATLEVKASNQAALSLYQKFDFQEAGRRRGYYKDTGEDALILWRGGLQNLDKSIL